MKKQFRIFGLLLLSLFAFTTLTSCGSDDNDGPKFSKVTESDFTRPWMLINVQAGEEDELYFVAFNGNRVAEGIMNDDGSVYDVAVYNSWKLDGDKLYINGKVEGVVEKVEHNGVQMLLINNVFYLQSNVKVEGRSIEDELSALGIDRELLWDVIMDAAN